MTAPVSWRGRHAHKRITYSHDTLLARLLVAGGSLGDGPEHSLDRAPSSWLAIAGGLIALIALATTVVFVL